MSSYFGPWKLPHSPDLDLAAARRHQSGATWKRWKRYHLTAIGLDLPTMGDATPKNLKES